MAAVGRLRARVRWTRSARYGKVSRPSRERSAGRALARGGQTSHKTFAPALGFEAARTGAYLPRSISSLGYDANTLRAASGRVDHLPCRNGEGLAGWATQADGL